MDDNSARKIQLGSDAPKTSNTNLWLALGLGVLAFIANYSYLKSGSITALRVKPGTTILAGTRVAREQFAELEISGPLEDMKKLLVSKSDFNAFSGIPLAETLSPGELLMQSSFSTTGGRKLSDVIPQKSRAISLPLNKASGGIARQLKVGNLIDVYDCMGPQKPVNERPDGTDLGLGNPFLQGVKVVAVGDSADVPSQNSDHDSVTVLVPSVQVPTILPRVQAAVCISLIPTSGD